ncbi:hypothetical protein A9Q81_11685 [Gammaproteobacteria bacterium 42_54_T18]|nr:hypothetical protein A9Q81_11685 [Gammaproteobacteria bacterium 42_54_T18]
MPLARAAGFENYSTNSANYIPEIFSGKLVKKFYTRTVFGDISNTDYEGEIKEKGDVVHIRTQATIIIDDYEVGGGLGTPQRPVSPSIDLEINRAKKFNIGLSDVDSLQSDIKLLDQWADDAAKQMKIKVDRDLLGSVYADAAATNSGATAGAQSASYNLGTDAAPVALTKANVVDHIVDIGDVLSEADIDEEGRWLVLPTWMCGLIKRSELKDASLTGDSVTPLRNGKIGMIDNFTIYSSNNIVLGANGKANIIAGHKCGLTFASQMTKSRIIDDQDDFQKLLQGLNLYGYEVINDVAIAHAVVEKG